MAEGDQSMGNGNGSTADRMAESVGGKIVSRYVLPAAVALVGALGTLILNDIRTSQSAVSLDLKLLGASQAETTTAVKVLSSEVKANRERSDTAIDNMRSTINRLDRPGGLTGPR